MKALIVVGIVILAIGLLFESLLNVKAAFKWFSKNSNGQAGKDFNTDFKNQFNNMPLDKKEDFIESLPESEKPLFKEYLSCSKDEEKELRDKLDEKHVFNMFNRWARLNNIPTLNMSSYKN